MKKYIGVLILVLMIVVGGLLIPVKQERYDYLRLHIRANSNLDVDQNIKYEVKQVVVDFLTPHLCKVKNKQEAVNVVNEYSSLLKSKCLTTLQNSGFDYSVNIKIANEYFPTRTYANTTLESGYYDAVIIELGEAKGDNWWCVMYPPLCFVNNFENTTQIKYKSIVYEWFEKIFN